MSGGVSVAGIVMHFAEAVKLLGMTKVKGLTKIGKIFAFFAPFGKFSSILHRTPISAHGGRFCAKFCACRILTSLPNVTTYVGKSCKGKCTWIYIAPQMTKGLLV